MLDYPVNLIGRVIEGRLRGSGDAVVRRVSTDSRTVEPGDLFFAVRGENFDGNEFAADALKKGAVAVVVETDRAPKDTGAGAVIEVPDPVRALGELARWHRDRFNLRLVAVTGSIGKTTTKDLIHAVLSQQWKTLRNAGNLNTEIGLPLTLLQIGPEHQAAVVELGMRGPGQIRYLARIARPEVAVITNIGYSHLEVMGTQDAIADAKAEVLDYLPRGGTAVLNSDDPYFSKLKQRIPPACNLATFGTERAGNPTVGGTYLGSGPRPGGKEGDSSSLGTRFTFRAARGTNVRWAWIPMLGRHNMRNALAAAAVGQAMGVSWPRIGRGLGEAELSAMRMSVHRLPDGGILIDDAYNASSPEAMQGALEVLGEMPGLRKIAVLGSMLELGELAETAHREVGEAVARVKPNLLITVGSDARTIALAAEKSGMLPSAVIDCDDNDDAWVHLRPRRRPGDVILVKGSRGMAMEALVREIRGEGG